MAGTVRMDAVISIVAAIIIDRQGRALLVRKRGTRAFMQPGGKYAAGDSLAEALCREILEELGCGIDRSSLAYLGRFTAPAANEPNTRVEADLFSCRLSGDPTPLAEIDELLWLAPADVGSVVLAPSTEIHVMPRVAALQQRLTAG